jgi:hypothetical protein
MPRVSATTERVPVARSCQGKLRALVDRVEIRSIEVREIRR